MPTLEEAIEYIRMGDRDVGRQMLEEILETDENNEEVWLWLSSVVESDEDREICLENVLALNPNNVIAQRGLEALQSGTFNVNELLSDVLGEVEEEEEEGEVSEATFLDEFMAADDIEEELVFPDSISKPKKKGGGGLNIRFIIIAVLVIVILVVLGGGAAVFFMFGGGDGTPVEPSTGQETPVESTEPTPTIANTPTPAPTATETPDFSLPEVEPTLEPSPTATQVVSPTPSGG